MENYYKALEIFQNLSVISPFSQENLQNLSLIYRKLGLKEESFHTICKTNLLLNQEFDAYDSSKKSTFYKNSEIVEPSIDITQFPLNLPSYQGINK